MPHNYPCSNCNSTVFVIDTDRSGCFPFDPTKVAEYKVDRSEKFEYKVYLECKNCKAPFVRQVVCKYANEKSEYNIISNKLEK